MKAKEIINIRVNLDKELNNNWRMLRETNVISKKLIHPYDLKKVYALILKLKDERALTKLKLACINLGFTKLADLPNYQNQYNVFKLSELKEIIVGLGKIPTLDPKKKIKTNKKEILTYNWINQRITELKLECLKIENEMTKFNEETEFDDTPITK